MKMEAGLVFLACKHACRNYLNLKKSSCSMSFVSSDFVSCEPDTAMRGGCEYPVKLLGIHCHGDVNSGRNSGIIRVGREK